MNAVSLVARVRRRKPGYDDSEYLDEVNAAYKECWDYITQLEDSYFTDVKVVSVAQQSAEFDLLYNSNGNLSSAISPRFFQIERVRIKQINDTNWLPATPRGWNDPQYLVLAQDATQPPMLSPPYYYQIFAKGSLLFARPFPGGTQIEVTYNFIFTELKILTNGTVTTAGNSVTGASTNFLQIVGADFQKSLPGNDEDSDIGVELVLANQNQNYRVQTITTDASLTTINPIVPPATNVNYSLATIPDIPNGHHNVISTVATRNIMSTPGNDTRFTTWAALAEKELGAMRDSVMQRQKQEPPRRGRFPFALARQTSYPTVSK
jgi:hypothetical protein